jgi:hypothetical protein
VPIRQKISHFFAPAPELDLDLLLDLQQKQIFLPLYPNPIRLAPGSKTAQKSCFFCTPHLGQIQIPVGPRVFSQNLNI